MRRTLKYASAFVALSVVFTSPAGSPQSFAHASPPQMMPAYPDTAKGLNKFLDDALKVAKSGDSGALAALVKNLEIPDYETWYSAAFGTERGKAWADFRRTDLAYADKALEDFLTQAAHGGGKFETHAVSDEWDTFGSMGINYDCMKQPADIYVATWLSANSSNSQAVDLTEYFVFIDGAFRWDNSIVVANRRCVEGPGPQIVAQEQPPAQAPVNEAGSSASGSAAGGANAPYRLGVAGVSSPQCLSCPQPHFSQEARDARYQGAVFLVVLIQPDGHASEIKLAKGLGMGQDQTAIEAAESWRFKPAIGPSGAPVPVLATIEISFRLY